MDKERNIVNGEGRKRILQRISSSQRENLASLRSMAFRLFIMVGIGGWLVGWLFGWSVGRLVDRSVGRSVGR
uniref:Uncharacterized protein n=1 Tax=Vespula pensylvanica TaxID=30213 RepID=A0A834KUS0_VESPE|nr:hypothetical protein H0235_013167 [Vespula pensylvanica]